MELRDLLDKRIKGEQGYRGYTISDLLNQGYTGFQGLRGQGDRGIQDFKDLGLYCFQVKGERGDTGLKGARGYTDFKVKRLIWWCYI